MRPLSKKFQQIWDTAWPYQDTRDEPGHAETTISYAQKLIALEKENLEVNEDVIIPAIILHDIGWSQIPKEQWQKIYSEKIETKNELTVTLLHQKESVKLAKQILKQLNYPIKLTEEILEIISQHDTRQGFISANEGLTRDADRLWRFSRTGITADIRRYDRTPEAVIKKLEGRLAEPNFFFSNTANKLAHGELENRNPELKIK